MEGPGIAVTGPVVSPTSIHIVAEPHQCGMPASALPSRAAHGLGTSACLSLRHPGAVVELGSGRCRHTLELGRVRERQEVLQRLENVFFHRREYSASGDHICFFCLLPCFALRFEREFTCHRILPFKVYRYDS